MRLALTGCFWCYVTMGSCSNSSVLQCDNGFVLKQLCSAPEGGHRTPEMHPEQAEKNYDNGFVFKQLCSAQQGGHRTPEMQTEQAQKSGRAALGAMTMGSCSNSSVQLHEEDIERLRCKPSRLKRAGELDEIGSDWMLLVLCDNGFVFKQLCSAM